MWTEKEKQILKTLVRDGYSYGQIGLNLNKKKKLVGQMARKLGVKSSYKYRIFRHDRKFFHIPNIQNSYYAGIIAADGCLGNNKGSPFLIWSASNYDKSVMENFKKDCGYTGEIKDFRNKHGYAGLNSLFSRITIHGITEWMDDLRENFNIVPQKTERLPPPTLDKLDLELSYLCGYLDGDGSIYTDSKTNSLLSISFTSCSTIILTWIKHLVDSLNLPFAHYKKERNVISTKKTCSTFRIAGIQAVALYDILNSIPVKKLERKWTNPSVLNAVKHYKQEYPEIFKNNYLDYLQLPFDINYKNSQI